MRNRQNTYLGCLIVFLAQCSICDAQQAKPSTPAQVISELRKLHDKTSLTFVVQGELDALIHEGGGGACPSAAAIDAVQALRLMSGREPLENPHKAALLAYRTSPELLKGRLTNHQFVELMRSYSKYFDEKAVSCALESAPNSPHRVDGPSWDPSKGPRLSVEPGQLQVVSYTVKEPDGTVLGRHFVLLTDTPKGQVEVLDPAKPEKPSRYILEYRRGPKGPYSQVFFLNPAGFPRSTTYEVNTIFTLSLSDHGAVGKDKVKTPPTPEDIKDRIDATARKLKGTKEFLDPRAWRKQTAEYGLPALDLPEFCGGANWPAAKMIDIFRHAGRHNLNLRDVVGGAHVRPLLASSVDEIRDIVREVANGNGYMAISLTEPGSGSDFTAMKTTATKVKGGYLINGEKMFNARLEQATYAVVFTRAAGAEKGLSAFVVPMKAPGITIKRLEAHGLIGNSFGGMSLKDVFVKDEYLLGEDGKGYNLFTNHFQYWRLMQAASAIGTGERALEQMVERLKAREAFGGPIGRFTHLQQQVGQHRTELSMAFSFAREAAELLDRGDYKTAHAMISGIKAEGVEIALKASDAAMRAFGGEGYSTNVDLGDRVRDLMGLRIADGTTDVLRMDVVREVYGKDLWDMAVRSDAKK